MRNKATEFPPLRPPVLNPRTSSDVIATTQPPRRTERSRPIRERRKLNGFFRFLNGLFTITLLGLLLTAALAFFFRSQFNTPGPLQDATFAVVPKGEGILEIAERLEKSGIVADRRVFVAQYYAARFVSSGNDKSAIKAGEFEIKKGASVRQVFDTLVEGRAVSLKITLREGLTSHQIVELLKADTNLSGEVPEVPPEGTLFPDTYHYSRGMGRQEFLDRMAARQQQIFGQLWEKRQKDLPYQTREQALVMASIVEKETGRSDEREKVAAVFVNRLRKAMRLQSDPTIVYGIAGGQGTLGRPISRADIDGKTPYNTYQIDGLPPGPICNPGKSAFESALNPAKTNDIYFVADTNGGHTFTTSLKDHNAAVQNLRRWEKDQKDQRVRSLQQQGATQAESATAQQPVEAQQPAAAPVPGKAGNSEPSPAVKKAKKAP